MEKFDVIIVGAGLAGLSAGYALAKAGVEVLLLERGDYPGAKNVTGGRIYLNPVRQFFPENFWDKAPLERPVTTEIITMVSDHSSTSMRFRAESFATPPYQSYTIQRSKFDRWFGSQATNAGAMLVNKSRVDELIWDNGRVAGVIAGGEELGASVVLACDGALSMIAEKAGLRAAGKAKDFAVGFKEVIELPEKTIEDRFGLANGEGAAQLFMGTLTKGRFGGGFAYTNKNSLSLGMVVGIRDLMEKSPAANAAQLLEEFKLQPDVAALIAGGELIEYSAHVLPEAGYDGMSACFGNGILVAGDAAGLALNMGLLVRGMEFAIGSGFLAAQTIQAALEQKDVSAHALSAYKKRMEQSFVLQDMKTFRAAPHVLENPRLFNHYPALVCKLMQDLFTVGAGPKTSFVRTARNHVGVSELTGILKDAWGGRKL